jgi:hypothetical protein
MNFKLHGHHLDVADEHPEVEYCGRQPEIYSYRAEREKELRALHDDVLKSFPAESVVKADEIPNLPTPAQPEGAGFGQQVLSAFALSFATAFAQKSSANIKPAIIGTYLYGRHKDQVDGLLLGAAQKIGLVKKPSLLQKIGGSMSKFFGG